MVTEIFAAGANVTADNYRVNSGPLSGTTLF